MRSENANSLEPERHSGKSLPLLSKIYVINLANRPDRRREMYRELRRIGLSADTPVVEIFTAFRPDDAGAFPSIGARGCFLSHLGVLQRAHHNGDRAFLLLEDDATFTPDGTRLFETALKALETTEWSIAYLGYRIDRQDTIEAAQKQAGYWCKISPQANVETAHAIMIHQRALEPLIEYLEQIMARPAGHPSGGPMHVDGAYYWFRREHPEFTTLLTLSPYLVQRPSKSDITPTPWKDRLPFTPLLRRLKARLRAYR